MRSDDVFAVGDYVRFDAPNGSTGKVVFADDHAAACPRVVVEWVYGRDVHNEVMTGCSTYYKTAKYELKKITQAEYEAVRDRIGFGGDAR